MSKISRFEDLIAWQKARQLTSEVYRATRGAAFARDYGVSGQIRASVSIMSNTAEGFERGKRAEFHQFLSTAKASCAEVRSQVYVALDTGYIEQSRLDSLMSMDSEVPHRRRFAFFS